LKLEV